MSPLGSTGTEQRQTGSEDDMLMRSNHVLMRTKNHEEPNFGECSADVFPFGQRLPLIIVHC